MAGNAEKIKVFKHRALQLLKGSQPILALLSDNADIDVNSDAAHDLCERAFFDHDYIDDTVQSTARLVMVEAEIIRTTGSSFGARLYIQIVCDKRAVALDSSVFPGVLGNRVDNIVEQVDKSLNSTSGFGINSLDLTSVLISTVPEKFTSKTLTYTIYDFSKRGKLWG